MQDLYKKINFNRGLPLFLLLFVILFSSTVFAKITLGGEEAEEETFLMRLGYKGKYCSLKGCTMKGDINLDNNSIINAVWVNLTNINSTGDIYAPNAVFENQVNASSFIGTLLGSWNGSSDYVPYIGATQDVNISPYDFSSNNMVINKSLSIGAGIGLYPLLIQQRDDNRGTALCGYDDHAGDCLFSYVKSNGNVDISSSLNLAFTTLGGNIAFTTPTNYDIYFDTGDDIFFRDRANGYKNLMKYDNGFKSFWVNGSVNSTDDITAGDDLDVADDATITGDTYTGRLNVNREPLSTVFVIEQLGDSNGFRMYGYDDKNTDYMDFYINGNGAGNIVMSNGKNIFFQDGISLWDGETFSFGSGGDSYTMMYSDVGGYFRYRYSGVQPNRDIMYSYDNISITRFDDSLNLTNNLTVHGNILGEVDLNISQDAYIGDDLDVGNSTRFVSTGEGADELTVESADGSTRVIVVNTNPAFNGGFQIRNASGSGKGGFLSTATSTGLYSVAGNFPVLQMSSNDNLDFKKGSDGSRIAFYRADTGRWNFGTGSSPYYSVYVEDTFGTGGFANLSTDVSIGDDLDVLDDVNIEGLVTGGSDNLLTLATNFTYSAGHGYTVPTNDYAFRASLFPKAGLKFNNSAGQFEFKDIAEANNFVIGATGSNDHVRMPNDGAEFSQGANDDAYHTFDGNSWNFIANATTSTDDLEFYADEIVLITNNQTIYGDSIVTGKTSLESTTTITGRLHHEVPHMYGTATEEQPIDAIDVWHNVTFNATASYVEGNMTFLTDNETLQINEAGDYKIFFGMGIRDTSPAPSATVAYRVIKNGVQLNGSYFETFTSRQNAIYWVEHFTYADDLEVGDLLKMQYIASDTDVSLYGSLTYSENGNQAAYGYIERTLE